MLLVIESKGSRYTTHVNSLEQAQQQSFFCKADSFTLDGTEHVSFDGRFFPVDQSNPPKKISVSQ